MQSDELPVPGQPIGCTTHLKAASERDSQGNLSTGAPWSEGARVALSGGVTSVGIGQSIADAGKALVEAERAPHLKPKRSDEAESFVERFGIHRDEYDFDIARGHRSSDGRPIAKLGEVGNHTSADDIDHAAGRPYVRDRHRAPYAHPTVRFLLGAGADLPEGLGSASLRAHLPNGGC